MAVGEPAIDIYKSNVAFGGIYDELENEYQAQFKKAVKFYSKVDGIFPIGSIYMSVNDTNPSNLFGGEWEQIKDTFLLACGDTYANGATGGEAEHTLTIEEMPKHRHHLVGTQFHQSGNTNNIWVTANDGINWDITDHEANYTGGSKPHNNMPPYLAVYVWKRIG